MSRFFTDIDVGVWHQISLMMFFVGFVLLLFWVFRPEAKASYAKFGELPLEKDKQ